MAEASPRRAAVLGAPIAHSLSPLLHTTAYDVLGLDGWSYAAIRVDTDGLAGFLAGLEEAWVGLSLTMPLKRVVLPLLDEVAELAGRVGAVNTVTFEAGTRRTRGDNTDVAGMVAALAQAGVPQVGQAVVLGAGATACSAVAALAVLGVPAVTVLARCPQASTEVRAVAERFGVDVEVLGWGRAPQLLGAPLLVATTPAGATDGLLEWLPERPGVLLEVVYHPWPTPLAAAWAARGGLVVGGLELLVQQAVRQVRLFVAAEGAHVAPVGDEELVAQLRRAGQQQLRVRAEG